MNVWVHQICHKVIPSLVISIAQSPSLNAQQWLHHTWVNTEELICILVIQLLH